MGTPVKILLIVMAIAVVAVVVLAIIGNRMQKKQEAATEQIKAAAQTYSMLIIDKKKMKLKDANLPQIVMEQTPKYLRGSKVPIVKAKIGPKIMNFICDEKVFDLIPIKKEVKCLVSGIYIMEVKGARGGLEKPKTKAELKAEAKQAKLDAKNAKPKVKPGADAPETDKGKKKKK